MNVALDAIMAVLFGKVTYTGADPYDAAYKSLATGNATRVTGTFTAAGVRTAAAIQS
jgi:hypothetical protein